MATKQRYRHLLNRTSFGISPVDLAALESQGIESYYQVQLLAKEIPESPLLVKKLEQLTTLKMSPVGLFQSYRRQKRQTIQEALQAHIYRSIYSRRQLEAVMIDFWLNHFSVYGRKAFTGLWIGAYTQQAIAPHALGKFRDLLGAISKHPAMLFYLDNWLNTAPESPKARGRFQGLNENYARELMELHTLGADAGYTQEDVIALARILTGWGLVSWRAIENNQSGFYFDEKRHDWQDKTFLGINIPGEGVSEVEQALDILANRPETSQHISYKLAQYFVSESPPEQLVSDLAASFRRSEGNITTVLATLLHHPLFWDSQYQGNQFKTPYQYIISLLRLSAPETEIDSKKAIACLIQLDMLPYNCSSPNGYSYTQATWLNPDAILKRINCASILAPDLTVDTSKLPERLGNPFSQNTLEVIASQPTRLTLPLFLGSPEMMYR